VPELVELSNLSPPTGFGVERQCVITGVEDLQAASGEFVAQASGADRLTTAAKVRGKVLSDPSARHTSYAGEATGLAVAVTVGRGLTR